LASTSSTSQTHVALHKSLAQKCLQRVRCKRALRWCTELVRLSTSRWWAEVVRLTTGRVCPGTGPVHRFYNRGRGAVARAAASCCCAGACRSDIGACERATACDRAVLGRSPPDTENHGGTQGAPSLARPSAQEPCCRRPWQQPQQQPRLQQHPNQGYRPGVMRWRRQSTLVCTRTTS